MIYTPTYAGCTIYSFAEWVILEMNYKDERRAQLMFNGTLVNVKRTSDPEDIAEKYSIIRLFLQQKEL